MTRKKRFILGALLLAATALGLYAYSRSGGTPVSFSTATIDRGDVVATVGATGTVEAVATVQVGTQVTGTIWNLYADFNSRVEKDQVVARLEPSLFESRLSEAKANLVSAEANRERSRVAVEDTRRKLVRARELSAQDLMPQSDLDVAELALQSAEAQLKASEAQLEQAHAAVEQATVNLGHTVIRSPINGVVISRNVDVGQTVSASLSAPTLFTIAEDLSKMRVIASVDEADVGNLELGQPATFRVDAFPEDTFSGTVSQVRLAPIVVQNVVTYNALVDVDNSDLKLRPGMTANVTFEVARHKDVLRVPNAALRYRPAPELLAPEPSVQAEPERPAPAEAGYREQADGSLGSSERGMRRGDGEEGPAGEQAMMAGRPAGRNTLYLVQPDGKLRSVPVQIGLTDGTYTEITWGGVSDGDTVVTGSGDAAGTGEQRQEGPPSPMRFMFGQR
jgi:HlyD family secretion protein